MNPVEIKQAFYTAMNVAGVTSLLTTQYGGLTAIFNDRAPQADDSGAALWFPFVSFSMPSNIGFNDKSSTGDNALVQVDVWSRKGDGECQAIAKAVHTALSRASMPTIPGHITTDCEGMDFSLDPDGETRRCMMLFRVLALA